MKKYVVGFQIFDCRSLQIQENGGGTQCDPFVKVECCSKVFQSPIQENRTAQFVTFEHADHIWPDIELEEEQFESAYIEFSVYARNFFTRNFLIGKASFQLKTINRRQSHIYAKRMCSLSKGLSAESTGMITLTVYCLTPGDQPPNIESAELAEGEEEGDKALDSMENLEKFVCGQTADAEDGRRPNHVFITVTRLEQLPEESSPFITVEFAGVQLASKKFSSVLQCNFDCMFQIPVMTPVTEDSIIVKMWSSQGWLPDELLAQGLISFSELRNNSMAPRWFCFYGWDRNEIADVAALTKASGETIRPNCFKGKLLMSARVEHLESVEELSTAKVDRARQAYDPSQAQVVLFADVYEVCGVTGRECQVELSCETKSKMTEYATPNWGNTESSWKDDEEQDSKTHETTDENNSFKFNQKAGRIDPILAMMPDDQASRPKIILNVYIRGVLSGRQRVGYTMLELDTIPKYASGNPGKPRFYALQPMPQFGGQTKPASVLVLIEQHTKDEVRHNRKHVMPRDYIVRAYIFMARNIQAQHPASFNLQVSCAGAYVKTEAREEVRPMWMVMKAMKVTLCSDHERKPPTMEPIVVALYENKSSIMSETFVGKAVCTYEYMRQKDSMNEWEPFRLNPQWIQLMGGSYGAKLMGEVLVCFELLAFKDSTLSEATLAPKPMWPADPDDCESGVDKNYFCKLRKATIHFSLLGLRDMVQSKQLLTSLGKGYRPPHVTIEIKKTTEMSQKSRRRSDRYFSTEFRWREWLEDSDGHDKDDQRQAWATQVSTARGRWNFEMLQADKIEIKLPDNNIFEPFIAIKVFEESFLPAYSNLNKLPVIGAALVGEHRIALGGKLPVCWYLQDDAGTSYEQEEKRIERKVMEQELGLKGKSSFEEETPKERKHHIQRERQERHKALLGSAAPFSPPSFPEPKVNSQALPLELRPFHAALNTSGYKPKDCERLRLSRSLTSWDHLNYCSVKSFSPREGEDSRQNMASMRKRLDGKLESTRRKLGPKTDFWYKRQPLLLHSDVIDPESDEYDYAFGNRTQGFVKYYFKMTDGWASDQLGALEPGSTEDEPDQDIDDALAVVREDDQAAAISDKRMTTSFGHDKAMDEYAFDTRKLHKYWRSVYHRVRVRIYFVRAICLYVKEQADPYITFHLGNDTVEGRNSAKNDTNTPEFYRVEERDVEFPQGARLEVNLFDKQDGLSLSAADSLIGSTIIDLEDRNYSAICKEMVNNKEVPMEKRPLFRPADGQKLTGSLDMWVEVLPAVEAANIQVSELREPAAVELEIRIVIRSCYTLKFLKTDHNDVKIGVILDCGGYRGPYPKDQYTDTHAGSKGPSVFNWRIVYPCIMMPIRACNFQLTAFDANITGDVPIGAVVVDLRRYMERVARESESIANEARLKISSGLEEDECKEIGEVRLLLEVMTSTEANQKLVGIARSEPNEHPVLHTPTEGRTWGDVLGSIPFQLPSFMGIWKTVIPLILFTLLCLVGLRWIGLL